MGRIDVLVLRFGLFNRDGGIPDICHRHHRHVCVKKKLPGVNFYRFNSKNWQFSVYFVVIYAFFWCKFYSPKNVARVKKNYKYQVWTSSFTVPIKQKKTFTFIFTLTLLMNQYLYNISWNRNDNVNERID